MVSDDDLIERLESLQDSIDGLREDTKQRIRSSRKAIIAVAAIALLGIVVGAVGIRQVHDANASRAQRTLAACLQANEQTKRAITAAEATSDNFIDYLGDAGKANPQTDPVKLQQFVDGAKAAQHRVIEKNYPKRDCSPVGINRFYSPKGKP